MLKMFLSISIIIFCTMVIGFTNNVLLGLILFLPYAVYVYKNVEYSKIHKRLLLAYIVFYLPALAMQFLQ
ncbi:MAG: hypothetical protein PHAS_01677 [Phascolarctobacterium sp.]|jgi:hypothetical protein